MLTANQTTKIDPIFAAIEAIVRRRPRAIPSLNGGHEGQSAPERSAMTDIDYLKRHLQQDNAHSQGAVETQRLVLAFGHPFIGIKKPKGLRFGTRKMCSRNAANTVVCSTDDEKPSYVEGYICPPARLDCIRR